MLMDEQTCVIPISNVAYLKHATFLLRHSNTLNSYLPAVPAYLSSTTPFKQVAASTSFTPLVWCGPDSNQRHPAPGRSTI